MLAEVAGVARLVVEAEKTNTTPVEHKGTNDDKEASLLNEAEKTNTTPVEQHKGTLPTNEDKEASLKASLLDVCVPPKQKKRISPTFVGNSANKELYDQIGDDPYGTAIAAALAVAEKSVEGGQSFEEEIAAQYRKAEEEWLDDDDGDKKPAAKPSVGDDDDGNKKPAAKTAAKTAAKPVAAPELESVGSARGSSEGFSDSEEDSKDDVPVFHVSVPKSSVAVLCNPKLTKAKNNLFLLHFISRDRTTPAAITIATAIPPWI